MAKILPLSSIFTKNCQLQAYHFIWGGRLQRLALNEHYQPIEDGGLNLINVSVKAQSLLTTTIIKQFLKTPINSNNIIYDYWFGLSHLFFKKALTGPHRLCPPSIFKNSIKQIKELYELGVISTDNVTAKSIHAHLNNKTLVKPKVVRNNPHADYTIIFKNIASKIKNPVFKAHVFLTTYNILPTRTRLQKCKLTKDPFFNLCTRKQLETVSHIYCCISTRSVIKWLQRKVIQIDPDITSVQIPDFYSFNFKLKETKKQNSIVSLLSIFLYHI